MRWVTYISPTDQSRRAGLLYQGNVHGLSAEQTLLELLGDEGDRLTRAATEAATSPMEVIPLDDANLCSPIPVPPSVRDFMAFEEHVVTSMQAIGQKVDSTWYEIPVFYFTNPAAVKGPRDEVSISPGSSQFDYELEVAAIIGREGSDIPPAEAENYIAGYTILCDWSARDLQAHEMRQGLGPAKGKDSATSLGPVLVTPDELEPHRSGKGFELRMRASVNGVPYSEGSWSDIYWSFAQMIAFASRGTRLVPGDVIGSGTVGTGCILELSRVHGAQRFPWLKPGDRVRLEVEELGAIESTVRDGSAVVPLD
jgi:2-keto-4-pentenoate hydratase/2-oxohepta-3-ene-1,7-dioic acid hydratase in catechol pathway